MVNCKFTVRGAIAKVVAILLLSSVVLPATAFTGSHSTGRSHSRYSSHVRSYKGSHRSRRATSSAISRNRRGRIRRSAAAKRSFERQHPCPSTGRSSGRCPGYVVDHVRPLECGGADARATCSGRQWRQAKPRTRLRVSVASFYSGNL
jgi:hypothetical protein